MKSVCVFFRKSVMISAISVLLTAFVLSGFAVYYNHIVRNIPENIYVNCNGETTINLGIPAMGQYDEYVDMSKPVTIKSYNPGAYELKLKLFGIFEMPSVNINVVEQKYVIPGGFQIGFYLKMDGILVVDKQSVNDLNGNECNPTGNAIQVGDYILSVNGKTVDNKHDFNKYVQNCNDESLELEVLHDGVIKNVTVKPVQSNQENYLLGLWIKDDTQGIGTVTYINQNKIAALGHGVADSASGNILPISYGAIYKTQIISIVKGDNGKPGEFIGSIDYYEGNKIGEVTGNNECGIFGVLSDDYLNSVENFDNTPFPVGFANEVKTGYATIRMYTNGNYKDYDINIDKISYGNDKNLTFHVTSQELLSLTNGIVQGMSGCPIIQNNKVVGAVTHVFINDSTKGYGIFIEKMLEH